MCNIDNSFVTKSYIFISERSIFEKKSLKSLPKNSRRKLKDILNELDGLKENELVAHKDYGIAKFLGVETLNISGNLHDCLKLLYANNDKLYVPVENIELIKKYGNFDTELDKLGSTAWQRRKAAIKERINKTADSILKIAAERELKSADPVEYPVDEFDEFCRAFPYPETEDQIRSINDIKQDLTSCRYMDRLLCGDVGFGKTEIAMRAAFMVATDSNNPGAQIAILVPTTILCKQHFTRFTERFSSFGIKVAYISRLATANQDKQTRAAIQNGEVTIVIGTHAILTDSVKFKNLGMLIIDEEQHFGVKQKERLKELRSSIHVLSLSATPIPRTLQMSMIGIKDLSLIASPPLDRLSVKTIILPFDKTVVREALMREHLRGGRSFYVCPRISDIEKIEGRIKDAVPELSYKIAHGKMSPARVDSIMEEFYEGKFDLLLSTSIIESGIDIAGANTVVIHDSHKFGLSQLYQLRGRVGRSKLRGYAYLTIEDESRLTDESISRLRILERMDSLGSGFTIASHDMDVRGYGNLIGDEQSGQVKEIGVELYMDMLEERITLLRNQISNPSEDDYVPNVNLGLSVFIPSDYISDSVLKLSIYKRIGALRNDSEVEEFYDEIVNRFGSLPVELANLLNIVKIKNAARLLRIASLDVGDKGFVIKFKKDSILLSKLINFVTKHPTQSKIKPDDKLVFIKDMKNLDVTLEALKLLDSINKS
jgi:transcription-repair coupling factor (superfamily II helicase)